MEIIDAFKWTKDAYYTILGISLAPFFTCILSALRGYFQGMQWMGPPASSQIIEQIMRVIMGVGLTYLLVPKGIDYAAGGASFGAVAGAVGGLAWMLFYYSKGKIPYPKEQNSASYRKIIIEILLIAIQFPSGMQ
jgi:stage V sporulation protein B